MENLVLTQWDLPQLHVIYGEESYAMLRPIDVCHLQPSPAATRLSHGTAALIVALLCAVILMLKDILPMVLSAKRNYDLN